MDIGKNTNKALDQLVFGLTVNLGDIRKVAFTHVKKENQLKKMTTDAVPAAYRTTDHNNDGTADDAAPAMRMDVRIAANDATNVTDGALNATGFAAHSRASDGTLSVGT